MTEHDAAESLPETADPGETGDSGTPEPSRTVFSDAQQAHIGKLLAEERKAVRKSVREEMEREAAAKAEAERRQREAEAAKAKGDFAAVEQALRGEIAAAVEARDRLAAENDGLRAAMTAVLDAEWKALPSSVRDLWSGGEDDLVGRFAWLPKAKKHAEALAAERKGGIGSDPRPGGGKGPTVEQEAEALRRIGGYAM